MPSIGALSSRLSITDCARCIASIALLRFSCTTASDAWFVAARDLTSSSSCASRRCASSSDRRFFCASIAPTNSLPDDVELGAADVEARGQQRHFVLRRLRRGVRLHLDDFLLRLGDLGLRLVDRELLIGRIELDDDVARLHGGAGRQHAARRAACRRPAAPPASSCVPARRSPVAWTVRLSDPRVTRAVGTAVPRSGSRGTAIAIAAPMPATASDHDGHRQSTRSLRSS